MNRLAVVVLNWNGAALLEPCISSVIAQDYPNKTIIVVDNGSADNSREVITKLQQRYGEAVHAIFHPRNSGFAGGVNIGIRWAIEQGFDAVALLNNDAVALPNWLSELNRVLAEKPEVGIATGLLLHEDGATIDSTGDYYSIWGLAFPRHRDEPSDRAPESGFVFGATGGASLYRTKMLQAVGLFDEDFFAYYEDVDLSFRAQLAGWKVYYTKAATALHKRGETSKRLPGFGKYQMFKNLPQLFWKNVPAGLLFSVGWRFKLVYLLMFLNTIFQGAPGVAVKGLLAGLIYGVKAVSKRFRIQAGQKVPTSYIRSLIYPELPPTQKGRLAKLLRRTAQPAVPNTLPNQESTDQQDVGKQ